MKKTIFFLILVVILFFIIFSYMEQDSPIKVKVGIEGSTFHDVQFLQKREGQIKLNLSSKEAFLYDEGKLMELKDLTIFLPERDFKVFAQRGFYYMETGDFTLIEMVEGITKNLKILAKEANWDAKNKLLYTEKPIKIEGKSFTIEGNSGNANENLIELKKGVRAIVYSSK
ncbi:MAG: LPS export ABC transporter periplasmic protein LptC [Thermodesulfovibrio sp.]|nr:LPS export ABC transporter periplasmic protein LptC [Thermodesulfovibrio sp.]